MKTIENASTATAPQSISFVPSPAPGSNKIKPQHLERLAIVYVRQSDPQQVRQHRESADLQYKLAGSAVTLGWQDERVLVIDEDQGCTGRTVEGREGFQRLLAEVGLNHVGMVIGIEMSRLARSSKDWHQLIELCAIFDTLLADQDGLYDPTDYNDRLLLGLKGTMSEAELHILKSRMEKGRLNKASRGELFSHPPSGYARLPSGEMVLDPDEQAQAVIRLIFEKFKELGSIRALLRYLLSHDIRVPLRPHTGPKRGQLQWRRPNPTTFNQMLHHPIYAGAYSYGRRQTDPRRKVPGKPSTGQIPKPMDQWLVLLQDRLPAYISWEEYMANQQQLAKNAGGFASPGPPRNGPSLLAGLIVCGRCQRRMAVEYQEKHPHYSCPDAYLKSSDLRHIFSGVAVEELMADLIVEVLSPASLELSIKAAQDIEKDRDRLNQHWKQRQERANFQAGHAKRQYDAVDPDNRLVARELERQWEETLREQRRLEEEYQRFCNEHSGAFTEADRDTIRALSTDVGALWTAPSTSNADRQTIVRHLVERVVVNIHGQTEFMDVTIHWCGGFVTQHEIIRSVRRYDQLRDFDRLKSRAIELRDAGRTAEQIAEQLNLDGFHTPQRNKTYTAQMVYKFLSRWASAKRAGWQTKGANLVPDECWLSDLARELSITWSTLSGWCRRGWVDARKAPNGWWIVRADADERARLQKLDSCPQSGICGTYPAELTTPKPRHH